MRLTKVRYSPLLIHVMLRGVTRTQTVIAVVDDEPQWEALTRVLKPIPALFSQRSLNPVVDLFLILGFELNLIFVSEKRLDLLQAYFFCRLHADHQLPACGSDAVASQAPTSLELLSNSALVKQPHNHWRNTPIWPANTPTQQH